MGRHRLGKSYEQRAVDRMNAEMTMRDNMPSLSVELPISVHDGSADQFEHDLSRIIRDRRAVNERQQRFYRLVSADHMSLTVLGSKALARSLQSAQTALSASKIEAAGYEMAERMGQIMHRSRPEIRVPLGTVAVCGAENNEVGVIPHGWKGRKARVKRQNPATKIYHDDGIILEMGDACLDVLTNIIPERRRAALDSLDMMPRVVLLEKYGDPIRGRDFASMHDPIQEVKPTAFAADNPVITMHLGKGHVERLEVERIPVPLYLAPAA